MAISIIAYQLSIPFDDLLKVGDRAASSYSPNLVGEIVEIDDDTNLARVKWDKTGTVSHHRLQDLKKVKENKPRQMLLGK